jgi:hypothetical protein
MTTTPTAERVLSAYFQRTGGFIPDKFWRAQKAELRKLLLEEIPEHSRRPDRIGYLLVDRLNPFFKRFHEGLLDFGMHRFAEQSLKDRIEGLLREIEGFAKSYDVFAGALRTPYPIASVEDEVVLSISSRMEGVFEEKVKSLHDALKGKWEADARTIRGIAQRWVKKAPPEILKILEAEVASPDNIPPDDDIRVKWQWLKRMGLDRVKPMHDMKRTKLDPLKWVDFLQEVFTNVHTTPEAFTEFDLHGVKVVVDDSTVDTTDIKRYVKYLDEAFERLKSKHVERVWYGTFFIQCKDCGGVNPNTMGGVGGDYPIGPDVVNIYSRPSEFIVELITHELGHRYWFKFMSQSQRAKFDDLVRTHKTPHSRQLELTLIPKSRVERAIQDVDAAQDKMRRVLLAFRDGQADPQDLLRAGENMEQRFRDGMDDSGVDPHVPTEDPERQALLREAQQKIRELTDFLHTATSDERVLFTTKAISILGRAWGATSKYIGDGSRLQNKAITERDPTELRRQKEWETDPREVLPVSDYGQSNADEAFAEAFAWYVGGRDMDRNQIESFRSVLSSTEEEHDPVLRKIDALPRLEGHGCAASADCVDIRDIFFKAPVSAVFGFKRKHLKLFVKASIPVKDIVPCQEFINREALKEYVRHPSTELPIVVKYTDGRLFAQNHTRIAAQIMKGATHVTAKLYEYTGKDDEPYKDPKLVKIVARFLGQGVLSEQVEK